MKKCFPYFSLIKIHNALWEDITQGKFNNKIEQLIFPLKSIKLQSEFERIEYYED